MRLKTIHVGMHVCERESMKCVSVYLHSQKSDMSMGVCSVLGTSDIQMLIYELHVACWCLWTAQRNTHTHTSPLIITGLSLHFQQQDFFGHKPTCSDCLWRLTVRAAAVAPSPAANMNTAIMKIGSRTGRKREHPTTIFAYHGQV